MRTIDKRVPRAVLTCVAENTFDWFTKAYNLALSVRAFGGRLATVPIVVNFVGSVNQEFAHPLTSDLDVSVRVIEPFQASVAPTNKIHMLDLLDEMDVDVLVALDCDILVTGDFGDWLPFSGVSLRPEAKNPITSDQWRVIYGELGVPLPEADCMMISSGQLTYPYFNSGVVFIERSAGLELRESWARFVHAFEDLCDRWPGDPPRRWWADQIALACALVAGDFAVRRFPVGLNFPTIFPVHRHYAEEVQPPFLVHYHNQINPDGFVLASRNRVVNPYIDRFNSYRARVLGQFYGRLPRPSLANRVRLAVADHGWYDSNVVKTLRRSSSIRAVKRKLVG
jgi:hypothetical protein